MSEKPIEAAEPSLQDAAKRLYEPPRLVLLGSYEKLTAGNSPGNRFDAVFPVNTPVSQFTFEWSR